MLEALLQQWLADAERHQDARRHLTPYPGATGPGYLGYMATLASFAWLAPGHIVECGSCLGIGTLALWWGRHLSGDTIRRLLTIDQDDEALRALHDRAGRLNLNDITYCHGDTADPALLRNFAHDFGPIGFLYADADHRYEGCIAELENAVPHMVPHGKILVHDLAPRWDKELFDRHHNGVTEAVEKFLHQEPLWAAFYLGGGWALLYQRESDLACHHL